MKTNFSSALSASLSASLCASVLALSLAGCLSGGGGSSSGTDAEALKRGGVKPVTTGANGSSGGGTSSGVDLSGANVVMDAQSVVSETGGDDLAAARRLFQSASAPEANGGIESPWPIASSIGMRSMRSINDSSECGLDAQGNINSCGRLTGNLYWVKAKGLWPHVVVGQRQNPFITTPGSQWGPAEWATYQEFAEKLVRMVAVQYDGTGFSQALFEVGNEVDITGDQRDLFTLANPAVAQGAPERYEHYMRIFRVWSAAVAKVASENPSRKIMIGGPAMGGQGLFLNGTMFHTTFLQRAAQEGLRVDAVTHHFYGDVINGWPNVPGSALKDQMRTINQALTSVGWGGKPIFISEYGPVEAALPLNYRHSQAAWAARFVLDAVGGGVTGGGAYLNVRDVFGAAVDGSPTFPSFTYVKSGVDYPKPATNTFRMFNMLPGARRAATVASTLPPAVRAFASTSSTTAGLIVFNYDYRFDWQNNDYRDLTVAQTVTPGLRNLPFSGTVAVDRYLIDETTSNVAKYIDSNTTPILADASLTLVESFQATVDQGSLLLPARTLGPSGVSMWIVRTGPGI